MDIVHNIQTIGLYLYLFKRSSPLFQGERTIHYMWLFSIYLFRITFGRRWIMLNYLLLIFCLVIAWQVCLRILSWTKPMWYFSPFLNYFPFGRTDWERTGNGNQFGWFMVIIWEWWVNSEVGSTWWHDSHLHNSNLIYAFILMQLRWFWDWGFIWFRFVPFHSVLFAHLVDWLMLFFTHSIHFC